MTIKFKKGVQTCDIYIDKHTYQLTDVYYY